MTTSSDADQETLQQLLALSERGMSVVQEMLALLRDNDRVLLAVLQRSQVLEHLAWTDPLTGLRNRRGFDEDLNREQARAARFRTPVGVVLVDVRSLKAVNNQHGQLAGDSLLRAVGSVLRATARESDIVARFGGDEFAALLPGSDLDGCRAFLDRVRASARSVHLSDGVTVPIELAAGAATLEEAGSLRGALELASQRLVLEKTRRSA